MKIERAELVSRLFQFAQGGNGVVVGKPGVGKSYAIGELRDKLKDLNVPHLMLPVERLGEGSDEDVRLLLRRDRNLVDLLAGMPGRAAEHPVLVFDGFDAARGERQREGILRLIRQAVSGLSGKWRVLVTVRIFDARKSGRLLSLFPPLPTDAPSGEHIDCRHIVVPPLTEQELQQAFNQHSALRQVYEAGSAEIRSLFTIPFHLSLAEKALAAGANANWLSAVTSEVQLLDQYWQRRVTAAADSDNRRFLLAKATTEMVLSHTLTVRRERIYEPAAATAWEGLLSDEILTEHVETGAVSFSHNILFDFAVTALLLGSDPAALSRFIAEEPARPLFLRPSLVYHFTRLWHTARDGFWWNFWQSIARDEIHLRQIIRIVLPTVLINEARAMSDLAPLQLRLAQGDALAADAIAFTVQALRVLGQPRPELWSQFVRALAQHLDRKFAWDAGIVALAWLENGSELASGVREDCAVFGRELLRWAWSNRPDAVGRWFERVAGLLGIPIVVKTFETDSLESRQLLEQVLVVVDEPAFPIDCIWRLTHEIDTLVSAAPDFVAEVYLRVFGHNETSDEKTNIGGPILPLISNRHQDYDGCEYNLLQSFPKFVAAAPLAAIPAGIHALQAHVRREHVERYLQPGRSITDLEHTFTFRGCDCVYTSDGSAIWDQSRYPDRELELAAPIFDLAKAIAEVNDESSMSAFLGTFAATASYAFMWKRLLECGAAYPRTLGRLIWELAIAPPILHGIDVRYSLGEYLRTASEHLPLQARQQIEGAILAIPTTAEKQDDPELLERWRNRLLGCIPAQSIVTEAAATLRQHIEEVALVPANKRPFEMISSETAYREGDFLRDGGAEPDKPENRALRELYLPLEDWSSKGREATEIDALLPVASRLKEALGQPTGADAPVLLAGWTQLAEFAAHAILEMDSSDRRFATLRDILLVAAYHNEPAPDPEEDSRWSSAVWSPSPRNAAAQVFGWIGAFETDARILSVIDKLARDPVPSVRFLLANEVWRIGNKAPDALWPLLEWLVRNESNETVLGAVTHSLSYAWRMDKSRALPLVLDLERRPHKADENAFGFWHDAVRILADYAVWNGAPEVNERMQKWIAAPLEFSTELATSGRRLVGYLRPQQNRASFEKARSLLIEHLESIAQGLMDLQRTATIDETFIPPEVWRQLYGVIDETVMRIYFAADVSPNLRQRHEFPLDDISRPKFFRDVLPVLETVLSFGKTPHAGMLLAPTAHHLMQLLNGVVQYDPQLVLRLASDVIESSRRYDYALDSMAMKEVVTLVEALLADYSEYIQDDESIKRLLNILDAFVEAGWPDALNLVWRLDEIYR